MITSREIIGGHLYDRTKRHYEFDDHAMLWSATASRTYVVGNQARASAFFGAASAIAWPRPVDGKNWLMISSSASYVQFGGATVRLRKPHYLRAGLAYNFTKRCSTIYYRRATTSSLFELHIEG